MKNTTEPKADSDDRDYKLLRILCLFGGAFSPIITALSMYNRPYYIYSAILALLFSGLFFLIYYFTFKFKYFRKNAYYITCAVTYFVTASNQLTIYSTGFTLHMVYVLILIALSIILVYKNLKHLIYYMCYVLALNCVTLYTTPVETTLNRELYIAFIVMFSMIAYVYVKIRLEAQESLRKSEEDTRNILEVSPQAIVLYTKDSIIYVNQVTTGMFGIDSPQSLIGRSLFDFICPEFEDSFMSRLDNISKSSRHEFVEQMMIRSNGEKFDAEINIMNVKYRGEYVYLSIINDITVRKANERKLIEAEEKAKYMAYHDALTGLPNRHMLVSRLDQILSDKSDKERSFKILFIDLDRFKIINDTLGHGLGDLLLKQVSDRLMQCVRKTDIVSRYGGDEFVVILSNIDYEETVKTANRILDSFSDPFNVNDYDLYISPSIGISCYPEDGSDSETIINNADIAMYLAKNKGKNNFQFYSQSLK